MSSFEGCFPAYDVLPEEALEENPEQVLNILEKNITGSANDPRLTADEEVALSKIARRGRQIRLTTDQIDSNNKELAVGLRNKYKDEIENGIRARNLLVVGHLGLVVRIASNASRYTTHLKEIDHFQNGCIGLIEAGEKFDWRMGFRFSTYAYRQIYSRIRKEEEKFERTIAIPKHAQYSQTDTSFPEVVDSLDRPLSLDGDFNLGDVILVEGS